MPTISGEEAQQSLVDAVMGGASYGCEVWGC